MFWQGNGTAQIHRCTLYAEVLSLYRMTPSRMEGHLEFVWIYPLPFYQSQSLIKNIAGNHNFLRGTTIRTFPFGIFFADVFLI